MWTLSRSSAVARNGYPATLGYPKDQGRTLFWRSKGIFRPRRVEDTLSQALRWGEGRVSLCSRLLVIRSIKTSPAATPVAQSVSRSACNGRPASHDLGDVSTVCTIKEAKWKPIRRSKGGGIPEMRDSSGERKASLSRD